VWDAKRQVIWLVTGITLGTFVIYNEALDEAGRFDRTYFIYLEMMLLAIIAAMFYVYSKNRG
jgi:cell division protein FtsW (lipid II flippase)